MTARLTFLGAAQNVTGSKYLLDADGARFLIDCGLYQERGLKDRNWNDFPVPPESIDAVLLTHAHVDHSGYLPRLVKLGFKGPIYCTPATAELARIILMDAAHLQEEDTEIKRKRHEREGRKAKYPEVPLYTTQDAQAVFSHLTKVDYKKVINPGNKVDAAFFDAGHVLGSAMIRMSVPINGNRRTIIFSGDVGGGDQPLRPDPTEFHQADYVLVESTYGDRLHEDPPNLEGTLADIINDTYKAGGNIVIPSFALERAQQLLYHFYRLLRANLIPHLLVFLDSPMATSITEIFNEHPELFAGELKSMLTQADSPFNFPSLKLVKSIDDSKAINHIKGTVIIVAGAGMCNGGRIKHHLVTNISRPESTILFVGYQAIGTLGRQIVDGAKQVRILGQMYPVRARLEQLDGFSSHGDRDDLMHWLEALQKPPRHIFVTHGESAAALSFAKYVKEQTGWNASAPAYLDSIVLD